eukprot:9492882-Pyramimonas_sp.AAC.1
MAPSRRLPETKPRSKTLRGTCGISRSEVLPRALIARAVHDPSALASHSSEVERPGCDARQSGLD